jgi:hypothetical protein
MCQRMCQGTTVWQVVLKRNKKDHQGEGSRMSISKPEHSRPMERDAHKAKRKQSSMRKSSFKSDRYVHVLLQVT